MISSRKRVKLSEIQDILWQIGFGTGIVILTTPVAETKAEAAGKNQLLTNKKMEVYHVTSNV